MTGPGRRGRDAERRAAEHVSSCRAADEFASQVGHRNVEFRCGLALDLRLDLDELGEVLRSCPIENQWDYVELIDLAARLRRRDPMIPDESIDVVLAGPSFGLVWPEDRPAYFAEIARVLRPGGRAVFRGPAGPDSLPDSLFAEVRIEGDDRLTIVAVRK